MMTLSTPRATEALRAEIDAAFGGREYPGDDALADREPGCRGAEAEDAWRFFRGKSWNDVAAAGPGSPLTDAMAFLSFDGFAYYLPAFVHLALDLDGPGDVDGPLVFKLWSFPEQIAARLGPAEKRVTVHVLEYLADEYDRRQYVRNHARQALTEFWAYFTDRDLGLAEEGARQTSEEADVHAVSE